jgi:hypothetical protein
MSSDDKTDGLGVRIRKALAEPRLAEMDLDGTERIDVHNRILSEKRMLQSVFREFYDFCREIDDHVLSGDGQRIELGSGTGFIKSWYSDVLTTDIVGAEHLDMVLDAENMGLPPSSVRAFYGINFFHHLPHPGRFFDSLQSALVPGGGCVLIEPYFGPGATAFFSRLFDSEGYDKSVRSWDTEEENQGPMTKANQALSWVVFSRDRDRFNAEYPGLEIVCLRRFHNYMRYLLSGGLNFRALLPGFCTPVLRLAETLLAPIDHPWALHYAIVIRKRPDLANGKTTAL